MPFARQLAFMLICLAALAPGRAEARLFGAESFTLPNGLQVVVIPSRRAPVVSHMVWYRAGGADEKPGKSGIAHFLEHLMFKGTPAVPDGAFSRRVRRMGGTDNAFTTHDYTAYYQNVPRARLGQVMQMEADRMRNLTLDEHEVASERQVIIEERRQRVDNQPQALFEEQALAALFVNHPYATPVIGWPREMAGLTRQDALDWYDAWYAPNNAVVVISGDVTVAEARALAERHYARLDPAPLPRRERPEAAPLLAERRLRMEDPRVGAPLVLKLYRAPRGSEALELLDEILGGSTTTRLYKTLAVERRLAVAVGSDYDPISLNATSFSLHATPAPGVAPGEVEEALDAEIARLLAQGVTAEELKSAKERKRTSLAYYLDSLQGPALLFGRAVVAGFDVDYVEEWEARLNRITVEDVNRAAALVFAGADQQVAGTLLPADPAPRKKGGRR